MTKQERKNEWYRKNGMTEQQIAEINAYDKAQRNLDKTYRRHTCSLEEAYVYCYEEERGAAYATAR